jgi:hypothetical protein
VVAIVLDLIEIARGKTLFFLSALYFAYTSRAIGTISISMDSVADSAGFSGLLQVTVTFWVEVRALVVYGP